MKRYTVETSRRVHRGRVFDLSVKKVRLEDGHRTRLDIIEHPGAVAIVPVRNDGRLLLLHQLRVATGGPLYEIPAGTLEAGERPAAAARRELIEETGYRARSMRKIAEFYTAPGFCTEYLRVFLARNLAPAEADPDEDERITVVPVTVREAVRMTRNGRIRDAKSIIGIQESARVLKGRA